MKRFFDITLSFFALLFFLPLIVALAMALKFTGEGEIFYSQCRVGKNGKFFNLIKFATMQKNSPNIGTGNITIKNDLRVLPLGNFLRKTKINELPQLFNVFIGDMSIIGPRPLTEDHFFHYPPAFQQLIVSVKPGLSGIGSIVFRDEEKMLFQHKDVIQFYKNQILPFKGSLEVWFVNNHSLANYLTLIILTLWVIFFPKPKVIWLFFPSLPRPPLALKRYFE